MKILNYLNVVFAVTVCGCAGVASRDFDKATRLADIQINVSEKKLQSLSIPPGEAQIVVAVPNYQCAAADPAGRVRVVIERQRQIFFDMSVRLDQLTWSHGANSCHAYGYIYNANTALGSKLLIPSGDGKFNVTVETYSSQAGAVRPASVWVIYGGRVPSSHMFATPGDLPR